MPYKISAQWLRRVYSYIDQIFWLRTVTTKNIGVFPPLKFTRFAFYQTITFFAQNKKNTKCIKRVWKILWHIDRISTLIVFLKFHEDSQLLFFCPCVRFNPIYFLIVSSMCQVLYWQGLNITAKVNVFSWNLFAVFMMMWSHSHAEIYMTLI